jgi:hypothetical protein
VARDTAGLLIRAQPPVDQQDPLGRRRHPADLAQYVDTVDGAQRQIGEHHRDRVARRLQFSEPSERLVATCRRPDAIVAGVAVQLGEHRPTGRVVRDDDHDHRLHRRGF